MRQRSRRARRLGIIFAASIGMLLASAIFSGTALAHAAYKSSIPAADAILKTPPTQVSITFAEPLNPVGLVITVVDQSNQVVSVGTPQISTTNAATATIQMQGVANSDIYRVDWHTTSAVDGDQDVGAFVFHINPNPPAPTPATSGATGLNPWLLGVIGLVIGGLGGFFLQRILVRPTAA